MLSRRSFLQSSVILISGACTGFPLSVKKAKNIITVNGSITKAAMGTALIHEHILVDFIGAAQYQVRWDGDEVIKKVLPYLQELKAAGCQTLVDCTPNYLGRDVVLLQRLSKASGLHIITNTGYYGGSDNKFLPAHAFTETEDQLAERWIKESREGIDGTTVRPGFMKISVNSGSLSEISKKLIRAAARCHLQTGLTIASHTGTAVPAFEQIEILKKRSVKPDAFIWVHAQAEKDWEQYKRAAQRGAWVSLDGLNENNVAEYVNVLSFLKKEGCLHRTLVSHDAGWYDPGKHSGGDFRGYTTLFNKLVPALKAAGYTAADVSQLVRVNPKKAFAVNVRSYA